MAVHVVGLRDSRQHWLYCQVFGPPDFYHYHWDVRAAYGGEFDPNDTVIFARDEDYQRYLNDTPVKGAYDDSARF